MKLELSEAVKKLDEAADSVEIQAAKKSAAEIKSNGVEPDKPPRPVAGPLQHLNEVAASSPQAAIMDGWREVEMRLLAYWSELANRGLVGDRRSSNLQGVIGDLVKAGHINPKQANLLTWLRQTRNRVGHNQEKPSEGQAIAFIEAAEQAIRFLARDTWAVQKGEF